LKTRILHDGKIVEELDEARVYSIKTRCPDKWVLIDMETGEQYRPYRTDGKNDWEQVHAVEWKRVDY